MNRHFLEHVRHQAMGVYRSRDNRGYCRLDQRYWDAVGYGKDAALIAAGCLDALDELPMGGARSAAHGANDTVGAYHPYVWADREWLTPEQHAVRQALAEQIIAEILAEEAAT